MAVYFIQPVAGGPIKIGTAVDPRERLRKLQMGNWVRLQIVALADGGAELERSLHAAFAHLREGLLGEWFAPADELLAWIGTNATPTRFALGRAQPLPRRRCPACGAGFRAGHRDQRHCSAKCARDMGPRVRRVGQFHWVPAFRRALAEASAARRARRGRR